MKGRVWSYACPLVAIAQGSSPKAIQVIYPYYENPAFLSLQINQWASYLPEIRRQVGVIIVDDGSPQCPAAAVIEGKARPFPSFRVFRIAKDVRWNWLAARNIGAHESKPGWILLTDMDHVIPELTMKRVICGSHDPKVIYGFSRRDMNTRQAIAPHPNSWLMTREMFWKVGGYDETLSGYYGTDGEWRRRMAAVAQIHILTDELERHEYVMDSSTTRYQRKQPEDARVKQLIAARGKSWKPKTLSFEYQEVVV